MSDSESQNKKTDSSKLSWIYQLHKSELLKKLQELKLPFTEESTVDQLRKILSQHYKSQADLSKFGLEKQQPLKMTTSYNLQFPAFDGEKWESFQQQLECVIQLNDIPDEKKVTLLLTKVTPKVFETLTYLCSPEKPIQLSYEELCKKLQDKYIPKQSIALDRAVFRSRNQGEAEKVEEYVLELRKLAGKCNFKDKDDQIKEKFIDGVQSRLIKFELLKSDSNMTLEETIILAKTVEAALLQSNTKQKPKEAAEEMFFYRYKDKKNGSLPNRNYRREAVNKSVTGNPKTLCYCCGNDNHIKKDCRLIKKYCSECGKQGHLFKVCPKNPKVKTYLLEKDEMSTEAAEVSAEEAAGPEQKEEGSYDIYSINYVPAMLFRVTTMVTAATCGCRIRTVNQYSWTSTSQLMKSC